MEPLSVRLFASLFGVLLGLSLLKFGNPCVMAKYFSWPTNIYEWAIDAWPVALGYWLLGLVALIGIGAAKPKIGAPHWLAGCRWPGLSGNLLPPPTQRIWR